MSLKIHSEGLEIEVKGEADVFNGVDLQVKAIKTLIETLDFKFAQEEDMEFNQKTYLVLLDAIGSMLKWDMPGFSDESRNVEVVHKFLEWAIQVKLLDAPGYKELLDQKEAEEEDDFFL